MAKGQKIYWWESLTDEELLELKFNELELDIYDSPLLPVIEKLEKEIAKKGLKFHPHFWISDEWFSLDGIPGIAIPYYLFHPRLTKLHKKYMKIVEGVKTEEAMKIIRHEAGHAIDNAFRLRKSKERQKIFGPSSKPYPISYEARVYSKKYVKNLKGAYAQAHPDEDWAETFAVWLDPKSQWKKKYENWPASLKLKFIDKKMRALKGKNMLVIKRERVLDFQKSPIKLKTFYKKNSLNKQTLPSPLLRCFKKRQSIKNQLAAEQFIKFEKDIITKNLIKKGKLPKYRAKLILNNLMNDFKDQKLYLTRSKRETTIELVDLLLRHKRLAKDYQSYSM